MLSIIIPTLNEEKYLPLLLESIKKQNFRAGQYEIIVADADSEDRTVEIAKKYGCKAVKGGSPPKGRNEGAKIARGELFLFLDADIVLPEDFLEKALAEFERKNLDIATCFIEPLTNKRLEKFLYHWFYNFPARLSENFLPHSTHLILVKRKIHRKLGGFDEEIRFGEDHVYVRKGVKFGKFGILRASKIFTFPRRFYQDGWVRTYLKYILAELHLVFLGPIRTDIFKYKFGHYSPKLKISHLSKKDISGILHYN